MRALARPRPARPRPDPDATARRARRRRWLLTGAVLLLVLTLAGCVEGDRSQNALAPAGPIARMEDRLWDLVFPIAIGVFVLVEAVLIFAIVKFRDRGGDDIPKQVAGNTFVEIVWTVIPAMILAGVAVPTVQTIFDLAREPEDALHVRVIGKQYFWAFEYLDEEGQQVVTATELNIPTDRPVFLEMQSLSVVESDPGWDVMSTGLKDEGSINRGVIHSFWVPRLAGKQDVVPYHTRTMTIQADEPGTYEGQCAEFCGLSHSRMRFQVKAQEPAEFQAWLTAQAQPAAQPEGGLAAEGYELFTSTQCIGCHAIEGYEGAVARIGPNLTHFWSRDSIAGGILPQTEENLRAWLANPQDVKPGAQMPNLQLSEQELDALTAYLTTLE